MTGGKLGFRRAALGLVAALAAFGLLPAVPAFADEPIHGEGSTWSFPAIQQWQADLANQGETVNYDSVGSTAGRVAFYNKQADFAVSEIPFQPNYCTPTSPPSCTNEQQLVQNSGRTYAYMPIVAGGTSIGYNLQINGQAFRKLQLSSDSLTGIFTREITYWDDPAIVADNPGVSMPHLPIQPVARSDGSGTSAQFTAYMTAQQPGRVAKFCSGLGLPATCFPTSQYPNVSGVTLQNGSDGVANTVTAPYNNGAIGYAEYAYWQQRGAPVASIKNAAGSYTQPTAVNVAVALTLAKINPDYTQDLGQVYTNPDPRAYPISSYSYMIVPTNDVAPMDTGKGATLSKFILYFICQGQQEAQPLGYSPLPPNLVQLGVNVNNMIPGGVHAGAPTASNCNNPTFHGFLQQNNIVGGPQVAPGTPGVPSGGGGGGGGGPKPSGGTNGTTPSGAPAGSGSGSAANTGGSGNAGGSGTISTTLRGQTVSSASNGQQRSGTVVSAAGVPLSGGGTTGSASGTSVPVEVAAGKPISYGHAWSPSGPVAGVVIGLVLAVVLFGPPTVWRRRNRRSTTD